MLTIINEANIPEYVEGVKYLLAKSDNSEEVRQLAYEIIADKSDPIKAIFDFVRANVIYTPDPGNDELFTSPIKMVEIYRSGKPILEDCDGFSLFVVALCRAVGMEARVCFVAQANENYDHAIAEVYSTQLGRFVQVDASTGIIPLGWSSKFKRIYRIE
jgi:transglutaminase-like putative cysteine protease